MCGTLLPGIPQRSNRPKNIVLLLALMVALARVAGTAYSADQCMPAEASTIAKEAYI